MQFSDTTNLTGLIQECEFLTQIGDGNISGNTPNLKLFTRLINKWYGNVVTWILESQDEWDFDDSNFTTYPILTTSLVANQKDYALPGDILNIKRVEITYDGTNWYKAEPLDLNEYGKATTTTNIANDFSTTTPYYDMEYDAIFLYPIPTSNVTNGLKIYVSREVDKFTTADTTQEPGFDDSFHNILALGASYDWSLVKKKPQANALKQELLEAEKRLKQYYSNKQKDRNLMLKSNYINYE